MNRYLTSYVQQDLEHKIIIITGARQCGKTTLAKALGADVEYLNLDYAEDVVTINQMSWDKRKKLLILDEFHKYKDWKKYLKGLYDKQGLQQKIVVTGSAKLDTYRKVGDSLAGRYFQFRLFPLDIAEIVELHEHDVDKVFNTLIECGGFPEPYLSGSREYYQRWRRTHFDIILRQDLIDDKSVADIKSIEVLTELIKGRVGSGISYSNLARDLHKDHSTIKRWCEILENMYVIFKVMPYSNNIARSLLKEPKFYCFDIAAVKDSAAQLENIVAISILKRLSFLEDIAGKETKFNYCRTKDGREIDFYIEIDSNIYLIEVKTSDSTISNNFNYFKKFVAPKKCIQLVLNLHQEQFYDGVEVRSLKNWLANINQELL